MFVWTIWHQNSCTFFCFSDHLYIRSPVVLFSCFGVDRGAWKLAIHVPEPWRDILGFNSSLPQLVWGWKELLLLYCVMTAIYILSYKDRREHSRFASIEHPWRKFQEIKNLLSDRAKKTYFKPSCWPGAKTEEYLLLHPSLVINILPWEASSRTYDQSWRPSFIILNASLTVTLNSFSLLA